MLVDGKDHADSQEGKPTGKTSRHGTSSSGPTAGGSTRGGGRSQEGAQEGTEEVEAVPPGDEVTGEQDPVDPTAQPAPSTSTAPVGSASTGTLSVVAYMSKCQDLAKVWFKEVVNKKEVAYRDLIASLVSLVEEQSKAKDLQFRLSWFQ